MKTRGTGKEEQVSSGKTSLSNENTGNWKNGAVFRGGNVCPFKKRKLGKEAVIFGRQ